MAETLNIFTIVKDGMPFIMEHLDAFKELKADWHWTIVHGSAMNVKDTSWCQPQEEGLSTDGTTGYLNVIGLHDNVTVIEKPRWEGKVEMCNAALRTFKKRGILLECDADEIYTVDALNGIIRAFKENKDVVTLKTYCNYFLGKNIVTTTYDCYGNKPEEWIRSWRFHPSMFFKTHEPPVLTGLSGRTMERDECWSRYGIIFNHFAYVTEAQVAYKERFYGYKGLLSDWKRLQSNKEWPVKLNKFFQHVDDKVEVNKL